MTIDGRVAAPLEVASSYRDRQRGLLGRESLEGAFWLKPCRHVHTFRMRFDLDIALVDKGGTVLVAQTLAPGRLSAVRLKCRSVIEAEAGSFARWGLEAGSVVGVG